MADGGKGCFFARPSLSLCVRLLSLYCTLPHPQPHAIEIDSSSRLTPAVSPRWDADPTLSSISHHNCMPWMWFRAPLASPGYLVVKRGSGFFSSFSMDDADVIWRFLRSAISLASHGIMGPSPEAHHTAVLPNAPRTYRNIAKRLAMAQMPFWGQG
ncbi:uncharacterized protein TrAtP1_001320 [Trichoderma atroviride]|uniref:uncharacterized protein n=1 Tax=Hypocrea atroviridis TaxID=63577 RepID=UPI0033335FF1|nr:hypothetical protein TrAtP1_001320 [Trichoderma atroviride]